MVKCRLYFKFTLILAVLGLAGLVGVARAAGAAQNAGDLNLEQQEATNVPRGFEGATVTPRPDAQVPLDLPFKDEHGNSVTLRDYFKDGKPVVLTMVYYRCPMLCGLTMNGMVKGLRDVPLKAGKDYQVVLVSFDHRETPAIALDKKKEIMARLAKPGAEKGWHFLTGSTDSALELGQTIGFGFKFQPSSGQYLHQAAIYIVKPDGKVSTTIGGISFNSDVLNDSLVNASEGKIGSPLLQLALSCGLCTFDPSTGRYTTVAFRVAQVVGLLTILGLGSTIGGLVWFGTKRQHKKVALEAAANDNEAPADEPAGTVENRQASSRGRHGAGPQDGGINDRIADE